MIPYVAGNANRKPNTTSELRSYLRQEGLGLTDVLGKHPSNPGPMSETKEVWQVPKGKPTTE